MRRGLMAWDPVELPEAALRGRIGRVQAAMAAAGQDALILYTTFIRSGAVGWLTAFSPYWADGLLLVPRQGEPVFATTLSNRVASWVRSVKPVGELVHSPTPGSVLAQRLAADPAMRRVAVLELDHFPGGLYDEIATALPEVTLVDGSAAFAAARGEADAAETALLGTADRMARSALEQIDPETMSSAGVLVGAVEQHARLAAAEEVYVAIAPDLDADPRFIRLSGDHACGRRFALRATLAYKGNWIRRSRTFSRDVADRPAIAMADRWFDALLGRIAPREPFGPQLAAALAELPEAGPAALAGWMAEAVTGTRPLALVESGQLARDPALHGSGLVLTLRLRLGDLPWCGAGLVGGAG